jgi:CubicO group peptidase (beta-lactamase class C family)
MFRSSWLLAYLALAAKAIKAGTQCDLAGPGFPAPSGLSSSETLVEAIAAFENLLDDGLRANDTAWTVALFSSKEKKTLYEQYYTPSIDVGVAAVSEHSIFRIASISKVFSVWSFLIEVGDERFSDPITKYVPELLELGNSTSSNNCSSRVVYDDIDHVKWEEITLGQLASHAAGIPRDRKLDPKMLLTIMDDTNQVLDTQLRRPIWQVNLVQNRHRRLDSQRWTPATFPAVVSPTQPGSALEAVCNYFGFGMKGTHWKLKANDGFHRNARIRAKATSPLPYRPLSSLH